MDWYCVHTKPRREAQLAEHLRTTLGLETYYPRLRSQRTIRRVARHVTGPLFPRYLFCRFSLPASYAAVRYAPDAVDVVRAGGGPAAVSDALIAELKAWAGDAVDLISLTPQLRPGDTVEIIEGPMRGLPGVILAIRDDAQRVAVLLSFLECGAHLTIGRESVQRIA